MTDELSEESKRSLGVLRVRAEEGYAWTTDGYGRMSATSWHAIAANYASTGDALHGGTSTLVRIVAAKAV